MFVSNQDTNVVLAFGSPTPTPLPSPPYLNGTAQYSAEFAQFLAGSNGVRGVCVVPAQNASDSESVWIASEDDSGVYQFDIQSGSALTILNSCLSTNVIDR